MRFSIAAVLALASAVMAQTPGFDVVTQPSEGEGVPAGTPYNIRWTATEKYGGTVSIILLGGTSDKTLQVLDTIAEGVDNSAGVFNWPVDSTLGTQATYGLKLEWDEDPTVFQWSFPFKILRASTGDSSSSSGVVSSSTFAPNSTVATGTSATVTLVSSTAVSTPPSNLSTTTRGPSQTTFSLTTTSGPARTSSTSAPQSTSGATSFTGSTLALFGGIAMAVFAL